MTGETPSIFPGGQPVEGMNPEVNIPGEASDPSSDVPTESGPSTGAGTD